MEYRHKSGFQKRKERKEREEKISKAQKGQLTLTSLNFQKKEVSSPVTTEKQDDQSSSFPQFRAGETESCEIESSGPSNDELTITPHEVEPNVMCKSSVASTTEVTDSEVSSIHKTIPGSSGTKEFSKLDSTEYLYDFDIGTIESAFVQPELVQQVVRRGHQKMPNAFPRDKYNESFHSSLLSKKLPNGEKVERDWLVWSCSKNAFFCLPCRLFGVLNKSHLCTSEGYSSSKAWKKLYDKLPSHENNKEHIQCYMKWREMERRIKSETEIDNLLCATIKNETKKWKEVLVRILDVILFLGERGLALRGDSHLVGEPNNGNFLGILELIGHYDPVLREHLEKVRKSQQSKQRLQVHYLSGPIQNEFIELCARHVTSAVLGERERAKYYSIIVDATPDSSHEEQTTFIIRYLHLNTEAKKYVIQERFLGFVNCNKKTGADIAQLIRNTLHVHKVPLSECRGQGYDNGSNMKGEYKGAQSLILNDNPLATYSPCACHSLNLCGVDSAECCPKAITFFGVVQKCYTIFSSSPQRWEILKSNVQSSLHCQSETRWSARIDAVKPLANHLSGITAALNQLESLNLTAETKRDVNGLIKYMSSFECVLMASIWYKILNSINERNVILQARSATIDVEIKNLDSLLAELQHMRDQFATILRECKLVADSMTGMTSFLPQIRKKKSIEELNDPDLSYEEADFKRNTFFVILDSIISGINNRFTAAKNIDDTFSFLKFELMSEEEIELSAKNFLGKYGDDVSNDLINEIIHLKHVYSANFEPRLSPLDLLNSIIDFNIEKLFPNLCIVIRIFCTLPVTVASAERSFSALARIKNYLRTCSGQVRTSSLATLCIESSLARNLDFDPIIDTFAAMKARKANLY